MNWNMASFDSRRPVFTSLFADGSNSPSTIVGADLSQLTPAPALLRILDEQQGVFQLQMLANFTQPTAVIYPFAVTGVPSNRGDAEKIHGAWAQLYSEHQMSAIVTVEFGAPNDERQFYSREFTPTQLGFSPNADGPVFHARVSPAKSVARFSWNEANAQQIYEALDDSGAISIQDAYGEPANLDELEAVAESVARSVYLQFADHVEGIFVGRPTPGVEIEGTAESVTISANAGGGQLEIFLPPEPPAVDRLALLPPAIRRVVDRMVDA